MTEASAPGKLIIVGEYAVLDGAPAIAAAIDVRAEVRVVAIPGTESVFIDAENGQAFYFTIDSRSGLCWVGERPEVNGAILEAVISSCVEHSTLFDDGPSFRVSMSTDNFFTHADGRWLKLGIGSSAAVLVALVGALVTELSISMPAEELLAICNSAHHRFQGGRGSGTDVATAIYGGVVTVRCGVTPKVITATRSSWPCGLSVLPIWSGVSASTPELLAHFEKFQNDHPDDYQPHRRQLKATAERACVAWAEQSVSDILNTLSAYSDALDALDHDAQIGINTEAHDRIRQIVERRGAVYKISGAGGGDFGLALTDSEKVLDLIRTDCHSAGFTASGEAFAAEGLAVS